MSALVTRGLTIAAGPTSARLGIHAVRVALAIVDGARSLLQEKP